MKSSAYFLPCCERGHSELSVRNSDAMVRYLPTERWMRHLGVVLVDVEFDHCTNTRHTIQGIQEQPLMLQRTTIASTGLETGATVTYSLRHENCVKLQG